jgi:hypothetical protein
MMEVSVMFGRLALTNSPIPTSASGSRRRRADRDDRGDVRRIVLLGRRSWSWPDPAARRKFGPLRAEAGELALLKPVFFGDRSRCMAHFRSVPVSCRAVASLAGFEAFGGCAGRGS